MTVASEILARLSGVTACSLTAGYAVHDDFTRVLFPPGRPRIEKRNEAGRVIHLETVYPDGSAIKCTLHPQQGAKYKALLA